MPHLLDSLIRQQTTSVDICEIIVVSSASTDGTDDIVKKFAQKDARVKLIAEPERRGKSSAINQFIKASTTDLLVIESGDTIPRLDTIQKMIEPFADQKIGMVGGRPVPENSDKTFIGFTVQLLWRLHHRLASISPKLGEMVAFRKVFESIPVNSAVDEASVEALILGKGLHLHYAGQAVIHNKGPETFSDFIKQRRRIAAGHYWLKDNQHYVVSSAKKNLLWQITRQEIKENRSQLLRIIMAMGLECYCRALGWYDYYIRHKNPYAWEMSASTKNLNTRV